MLCQSKSLRRYQQVGAQDSTEGRKNKYEKKNKYKNKKLSSAPTPNLAKKLNK